MMELYHGKDDLSMATVPYLAMTASEFVGKDVLPEKPGWLLSPAHPVLPPETGNDFLLILTDQEPLPEAGAILPWLIRTVEERKPSALVLDFQETSGVSAALARQLVSSVPCPVAVSDRHAHSLDCPVFLSPCPHHVPLREHITPWKNREIWLDLAVDAEVILLKKEGREIFPFPLDKIPMGGFVEKALHCHYSVETGVDFARFTLWRTRGDLEEMAKEAQQLGIHTLVGLWCEWQDQN
ncbi:MAG: hypothetical protein IJO21_06650 [Oscillospiraceae bacterium]|nr:hypothetical protein [Oscillospiraceae bacterium]